MGRVGSRIVGLLSVVALVALAPAGRESAGVRMVSFGPQGELLIARPEIRMELRPESGREIVDVELRVNGQREPAEFDPETGTLSYVTPKPLPAGQVEFGVTLTMDDRARLGKRWVANIQPNALADYLTPDDSSERALRAVNSMRARAGLPAAEFNRCLTTAAELHARYLEQNDERGHQQSADRPGFFGETLKERLARLGWNAGGIEATVHDVEDPAFALESAFDAPYHRLAFLQPGKMAVGFGSEGDTTTMVCNMNRERTAILSPRMGETGVPTAWINNESPNPVRFFPDAERRLGYPIVIRENGVTTGLEVESVSVTCEGKSISTYVIDGVRDSGLKGAAFIIPTQPLARGAEYTVSARYRVDGDLETRTWSFSTGRVVTKRNPSSRATKTR
ncbi:MAG: CAP domain-containing protein [Fimbriimonadaceae bacterium]|nr:CAP domain-containing protein [Fimbriimonadaceae bacterium]